VAGVAQERLAHEVVAPADGEDAFLTVRGGGTNVTLPLAMRCRLIAESPSRKMMSPRPKKCLMQIAWNTSRSSGWIRFMRPLFCRNQGCS